MFKKIIDFMKNNYFQVFAVTFSLFAILYFWGCESQVKSIECEDKWITRNELTAEYDLMVARFQDKFKSLDMQDKFKEHLVENLVIVSQGGNINPVGVLLGLLGVLGGGAIADNATKRRKEKKTLEEIVKNGNGTTNTS